MQRIGFIAFPNFQLLSLSTIAVFECANMLAQEPLYSLHILSETGGLIRTSSGLIVETEAFDESEFDTLIVLGTLLEPGLLLLVGTVNSVICADALPGKPTPSETAANMPNAHAHRCADIESLEVPINLAPKLHSRSSPSQSLRL